MGVRIPERRPSVGALFGLVGTAVKPLAGPRSTSGQLLEDWAYPAADRLANAGWLKRRFESDASLNDENATLGGGTMRHYPTLLRSTRTRLSPARLRGR